MEYYLLMEENEIMSSAGKWMEMESNMLNKISRLRKTIIICSLSYSESRSKKRMVAGGREEKTERKRVIKKETKREREYDVSVQQRLLGVGS
jgi:hypothetical protein